MTTIGPTLTIAGEVSSLEDLTIEGRVNGLVTVRDASLTVEASAHVDGDLRAARVTVAGSVRGGVAASERIELRATASVTGNLSAASVVMADGARFNGGVDMAQRTIAAKVAQFKAAGAEPASASVPGS